MSSRSVSKIITSHHQHEGGGFIVRRPFPGAAVDTIDPFLLLDEMGPVEHGPGEAVGAPAHPHRGFETITYLVDGMVEHKDSAGHNGVIEPGGVQWMTAGSGVVHSEMPPEKIQKEGGRVHGFQIWLNLPSDKKMTTPRYQERVASEIPIAKSPDGLALVKVIAGQALGIDASITTHLPIHFHHWHLKPGASVRFDLPSELNGLVYVFAGGVEIGPDASMVGDGQLAILDEGDEVSLAVPSTDGQETQLLVLAGKPLHEPLARYGPFVMNHPHEIQQAIADYQAGRMGRIPAEIA